MAELRVKGRQRFRGAAVVQLHQELPDCETRINIVVTLRCVPEVTEHFADHLSWCASLDQSLRKRRRKGRRASSLVIPLIVHCSSGALSPSADEIRNRFLGTTALTREDPILPRQGESFFFAVESKHDGAAKQ
jgi:hypothetical protein